MIFVKLLHIHSFRALELCILLYAVWDEGCFFTIGFNLLLKRFIEFKRLTAHFGQPLHDSSLSTLQPRHWQTLDIHLYYADKRPCP